MSALSNASGFWYRQDTSGRFAPTPYAGDADGVCCVTFTGTGGLVGNLAAADLCENVITQAMNAAASVPVGTRKWTVDGVALIQAFRGGAHVALTPA